MLHLRKEKEILESEFATEKDAFVRMQKLVQSLEEKRDGRSISTWLAEFEQKDVELKDLREKNVEIQHNVDDLQHKLCKTEKLQRTFEKLAEQREVELDNKSEETVRVEEKLSGFQREVERLQEKLDKAQMSKQANDRAAQEQQALDSKEAENQAKIIEQQTNDFLSTKAGFESTIATFEARLRDEAENRQQESNRLREDLDEANNRAKAADDRLAQQQNIVSQKEQEIDLLKRHLAASSPQVQESPPRDDSTASDSIPRSKKTRRAANRSASTPTELIHIVEQTSADAESVKTDSNTSHDAGSLQQPTLIRTENRNHGISPSQKAGEDEDDMLDLDDSQLQVSKANSRPPTSQSDTQKAYSLGSQEVLDSDGVRFKRGSGETQTQTRPKRIGSPSSSLSEALELDESYKVAAETETQASQSQYHDPELQDSIDLSGHDNMSLGSASDQEASQKTITGQRNLQGVGRKLTPRPVKQYTPAKQKVGALPSIVFKPGRGTTGGPQKKVSALNSGPHNFKNTSSHKSKRDTHTFSQDEDDTGSDPISGPGSQTPQKRTAPQGTKGSKKARTEVNVVPLPAMHQRSSSVTPRRTGATARNNAQGRASATPAAQRRRSGRSK